MKKDIDIIRKIFKDEIYQSPVALQQTVSKIEDKKIQLGLLVELIARNSDYGIDVSDVFDIIDTFNLTDKSEEEVSDEILDAHDYYIGKLNESPQLTFHDLIFKTQNVEENVELINWLKSISDEEYGEVIEFCIENEVYELIPFIKSIRQ